MDAQPVGAAQPFDCVAHAHQDQLFTAFADDTNIMVLALESADRTKTGRERQGRRGRSSGTAFSLY